MNATPFHEFNVGIISVKMFGQISLLIVFVYTPWHPVLAGIKIGAVGRILWMEENFPLFSIPEIFFFFKFFFELKFKKFGGSPVKGLY